MLFHIMTCQELCHYKAEGRQDRRPAAEGPEAGYCGKEDFYYE